MAVAHQLLEPYHNNKDASVLSSPKKIGTKLKLNWDDE
jgi:hypothetical protein